MIHLTDCPTVLLAGRSAGIFGRSVARIYVHIRPWRDYKSQTSEYNASLHSLFPTHRPKRLCVQKLTRTCVFCNVSVMMQREAGRKHVHCNNACSRRRVLISRGPAACCLELYIPFAFSLQSRRSSSMLLSRSGATSHASSTLESWRIRVHVATALHARYIYVAIFAAVCT